MEAGSNERKVIGRVDCSGSSLSAGWVHSFSMTENYIIVPEMPFRYSLGNLIRAEPTPLYKFQWQPGGRCLHALMCKHNGKIIGG
ncbi:hypothetical protein ZOSMA_1G00800 [Zostera marina]|uniref:Uncharacterized protein n=1 Tax=Zostera marina TaxID=29655 RepID=A0A0K9PME0_ZOSMR|nr:hypothetical protein ZOSMA_1G00800 [Zostera marina]